MPISNLYGLSMEGIEISGMLTEAAGELTPEIEARLDALLLDGADRIEAAAMVVKQLEHDSNTCEEEAKRLRDRAKQFSDNAEKLKSRMVFALDAAFHGKIKTPLFTVWAQSSAETLTADLAVGFTPEMLHEERPDLVRVKMEFDRQRAVAEFKLGNGDKMPDSIFFTKKAGSRSCRIK